MSSQSRTCEDSGICSNSIDLFNSSLESGNLECLNDFNLIDYDGEDLLNDFNPEPMIRNRCNTWPTRHPTEFQTNDSSLMHGNIPEENT